MVTIYREGALGHGASTSLNSAECRGEAASPGVRAEVKGPHSAAGLCQNDNGWSDKVTLRSKALSHVGGCSERGREPLALSSEMLVDTKPVTCGCPSPSTCVLPAQRLLCSHLHRGVCVPCFIRQETWGPVWVCVWEGRASRAGHTGHGGTVLRP